MWCVFNSMLNEKSWKRYELETKRFSTYDDARKYVEYKADKYRRVCTGDDSCVESHGNDVFIHFLGIRIDFSIWKADDLVCYYV